MLIPEQGDVARTATMPTSTPPCPLCHATDTELLLRVPVSDLTAIYRRSFGVDVDRFFSNGQMSVLLCNVCDLRFFFPLVSGDPTFYAQIAHSAEYYMEVKPEFRYAAARIAQGSLLLEIGAGSGAFGSALSGVAYTGLEFSEHAARQAGERGLRVLMESIEVHAKRWPAAYDVVCSFQVLEHIVNPRSFLDAAVACLRPGGTLILSVPSYDSFLRFAPNLVLNMPPHHVTLWSDLALINAAALCGLRLLHIEHEKLTTYHANWFAYTLLRTLAFGSREELVVEARPRRSLRSTLVGAAARILGPLLRLAISKAPMEYLPNGHTVIITLRKPV